MKNESLDLKQHEVIESEATARILVHAGPGTGKTQVSAMRLARLVASGLRPSQILVLSFSRSAVRTLAKRLESRTSEDATVVEDLKHLSIRTFDSWTFRVLRQLGERPETLLARTHDQNIALLAETIEGKDGREVQSLLKDIRHLIIDEFQDLPGVRGRLVLALLNLLAPPGTSSTGFTVLGDEAQAIYGFAIRQGGEDATSQANSWMVLRERYGPELFEIELDRNYRAAAPLADIAARLRQMLRQDISGSQKLANVTELIAGLPISSAALSPDWLTCLPLGSVAILTRTNGEALRVTQKLLGKSVAGPAVPISLQLAGYRHPVPAWIAALLSPLRVQHLPKSQFEKIFVHCSQKLSDAAMKMLRLPDVDNAWLRLLRACGAPDSSTAIDLASLRQRLDWPDAFPDDHVLSDAGLYITTIHQSKGMEFDSVALLQHDTEEHEDAPDYPEEEACISFVAITRAGQQLGVIPTGNIHRAPVARDFGNGSRTRLCHWWAGWVNLEIGIPGDVRTVGFVDEQVLGGLAGVNETQELLLSNAASLRGHKVMLCKMSKPDEPAKTIYGIHLQEGNAPGRLIGHTRDQLTYDLLFLLHKKGYSLPGRIMNLRIGEIVTMTGSDESPSGVPEPYRTSLLWLGVTLFGTGDFKVWKRGSKGRT
jgi:DNA helicase-2/ATP-dependent DNA helicase PcrA